MCCVLDLVEPTQARRAPWVPWVQQTLRLLGVSSARWFVSVGVGSDDVAEEAALHADHLQRPKRDDLRSVDGMAPVPAPITYQLQQL